MVARALAEVLRLIADRERLFRSLGVESIAEFRGRRAAGHLPPGLRAADVFLLILVLMGIFVTYSWLVWAALLFFFNRRHPSIVDPNPLGGFRVRLAVIALAVFILSFTIAPVHAVQ